MPSAHCNRLLMLYAAPLLFASPGDAKSDGPRIVKAPHPHKRGNAAAGRNVFR